jgi:hypothetical protein
MINRKNSGSIIEGIILGILTVPIWLPMILFGVLVVLALPVIRCYDFFDNIAKKVNINLSKLIKLGLSIAFLGACGYGIFFVVSKSINSIGTKIIPIFMILILILLAGYFGLIESMTMVRYPNIPELTRKKDVPKLMRALKYDDREVQRHAAEALEEIGDERARKPLQKYYADVAYMEDLEYNKGRPSGLYF